MKSFNNTICYLIVVVGILAVFAFWLIVSQVFQSGKEQLILAEESYHSGEVAATVADRQEAFNTALGIFQGLENSSRPSFGNGRLYYVLGNTYYQLGQYPLAILNYMKAQQLMPRSSITEHNLSMAQQQLGLTAHPNIPLYEGLFLSNYLSLPERLQLFFLFSLLSFLFISGIIWIGHPLFRGGAIAALSIVFLLALSVGYTRYISPVRGVLVHAADIRRDAGSTFAKVTDLPLAAGSVVTILDVASGGSWVKVTLPNGVFGYIPQESIRLL